MQRSFGPFGNDLFSSPAARRRRRVRAGFYFRLLALVGILALTALVLDEMGRRWLCSGSLPWQLWLGTVDSWHTSQHLLDPYSAFHLLRGLLFYAGAWLLLGWWLPGEGRWWIALVVEAAWEVIANTPLLAEPYREAALVFGYSGEAIINSLGDIASFVVGYTLARLLPVWLSVTLFALVEGVLVLTIREGLVLNGVMLLYPLNGLKEWQLGG